MATGGRRHHAVDDAARERWALLGRLFRARRLELGYMIRRKFAEDRLPLTDEGNPNVRMVITVENNERQNYAPGRLEQFARAYQVTPESVYAVLRGEADGLTPAAPAPVPEALPPAPMEEGRDEAIRPVAIPVWDALHRLAVRGITDPSGAQLIEETRADPAGARLGLGHRDARIWDGSEGATSQGNRAWLVAEMHVLRRQRSTPPESGSASA